MSKQYALEYQERFLAERIYSEIVNGHKSN